MGSECSLNNQPQREAENLGTERKKLVITREDHHLRFVYWQTVKMMARLDEFASFCLNNRGNTLSDQLTAAGYKDPAQRASLKAQMRRAMAPGGTYRFKPLGPIATIIWTRDDHPLFGEMTTRWIKFSLDFLSRKSAKPMSRWAGYEASSSGYEFIPQTLR